MISTRKIKNLYFPFLILILSACAPSKNNNVLTENLDYSSKNWSINEVTEFKRGDFIVKPNLNFLPGTAEVPNGVNCGHAALVIKGFKHSNIDTLLANIKIVESMALDVPKEFQVREIAGYVYNKNPILSCPFFDKRFAGNRYRLRLNINESEIDSIIAFALDQKGDYSCWNAVKRFPDNLKKKSKTNWADNTHWYCSLLLWQSVLYVTGIDLDVNQGFQVYPNDLIANPIFNNTDSHIGRARF